MQVDLIYILNPPAPGVNPGSTRSVGQPPLSSEFRRNAPKRDRLSIRYACHLENAQLLIESVIDPAMKVVGGIKTRTNANKSAAFDANPFSTMPKSLPSSATAAGKAATQ